MKGLGAGLLFGLLVATPVAAITVRDIDFFLRDRVCPVITKPVAKMSYRQFCGENYLDTMSVSAGRTCQLKADAINDKIEQFNALLQDCPATDPGELVNAELGDVDVAQEVLTLASQCPIEPTFAENGTAALNTSEYLGDQDRFRLQTTVLVNERERVTDIEFRYGHLAEIKVVDDEVRLTCLVESDCMTTTERRNCDVGSDGRCAYSGNATGSDPQPRRAVRLRYCNADVAAAAAAAIVRLRAAALQ